MAGTSREDVCSTFIIICRSFSLRMRNVTDQSFIENQNTFMFRNFRPKILPFM